MRFSYKYILIVFLVFFVSQNFLIANEPVAKESEQSNPKETEEKFNPGEFIFDHVNDSYSWHICSYNSLHVAIPLPVILYSKYSGWHIFMSSKFHHGKSSYQQFEIAEEGKNKGKIVELINNEEVVPFDISIKKNVLALFISVALIIWIFLSIARKYKQNPQTAPSGLQSLFEPIILFIRDDVARPSIGEHKYEKFMPYLLTVFFFILFNNILGLLPTFPGGANTTGNIAITMTLALFTFVITSINGNKNYWLHLVNPPGVPWWLKVFPLIPIIEIMEVFIKPIVLMVRLFANIIAGHIIILGFFSLIFIFGATNAYVGYSFSIVSVAFVLFMFFLELLVAFIQAYVFTLLSAIYFGWATAEHHKAKEPA
jgi:F-type H+-transporting ATPase subunit a